MSGRKEEVNDRSRSIARSPADILASQFRIRPQYQPDSAVPVRESVLKWVPIYNAPPHTSMNSKYIAGSPLIRFISSQLAFRHHHYLVGFVFLGPRHEWYDTEQKVSGAGWSVRRMTAKVDRCHDGCASTRGWEECWPIMPVALVATVNETRLTHARSAPSTAYRPVARHCYRSGLTKRICCERCLPQPVLVVAPEAHIVVTRTRSIEIYCAVLRSSPGRRSSPSTSSVLYSCPFHPHQASTPCQIGVLRSE